MRRYVDREEEIIFTFCSAFMLFLTGAYSSRPARGRQGRAVRSSVYYYRFSAPGNKSDRSQCRRGEGPSPGMGAGRGHRHIAETAPV